MLYADDLVLIGETVTEIEERYKQWKRALHAKGLKINVAKTKVMVVDGQKKKRSAKLDPCAVCGARVCRNSIRCTICKRWVHKRCSGVKGSLQRVEHNFVCRACLGRTSDNDNGLMTEVVLDGDNLETVSEFCYLGDLVTREGGTEAAVTARISAGWRKFRELSGVLCGRGVSNRLKGILYKTCVRTAMTYGSETWAAKAEDLKRMTTADMRMVRLMAGVRMKDRRRNDDVLAMMSLDSVADCLEKERLRWYGHVMRRDEEMEVKRILKMEIEGDKKKGRPMKTWMQAVKETMKKRRINDNDWEDRSKWRSHLRWADSRKRETRP